eukprot:8021076-Pyramimonas_sp.AAC.1
MDLSLLPVRHFPLRKLRTYILCERRDDYTMEELRAEKDVSFADNFVFRTECVARTWGRPHAVENCQNIVPASPDVRSDWNFSVTNNTRILNFENVVNDNDNVKQDMSIDVYGRKEEGVDIDQQIDDLANA